MTWIWIRRETVEIIHSLQIAEHGGAPGMRDAGLLDSALARPKNVAAYGDPDTADLAAAYFSGLLRNHPFVDGNKRVANVCLRLFLRLNGRDIAAPPEERYVVTMRVIANAVDDVELAAWIRDRLIEVSAD